MNGTPNIYLDLTNEFNSGKLRAIICSGQAVVLHKLAIMSKDGDWIIREDEEAMSHILAVLERRGASYRFGAPLDARWMAGGWSAHFEFQDRFRVRADFFTRPPRLSDEDLARLWREQEHRDPPFLDAPELALMKRTNREKDYVVIGELARIMTSREQQLLHSRSPRDLLAMYESDPLLFNKLAVERPLLREAAMGLEHLSARLDEERRDLIRRNEQRLERHNRSAQAWKALWPDLSRRISGLPLRNAHEVMVEAALNVLPFAPAEDDHG